MRPWKSIAAAAVLAAAGILGVGFPDAEAGSTLVVKRFLVGHLEPFTGRFIALGGRGPRRSTGTASSCSSSRRPWTSTPSAPGPSASASPRRRTSSPRPGGPSIHTASTRSIPAPASSSRSASTATGCSSTPNRWDSQPFLSSGEVFARDTTYSVTLPGVDQGALKTLVSSRGAPLALTFTTTFRTSDEEFSELFCPDMDED